jgi:hypothetical protein
MKFIETAAVAGSQMQTNGDRTMKKIVLSLATLAAISSTAFARTDIDPRDRVNHSSSVPAISSTFASGGDTAAFAVPRDERGGTLSAYERVMQQSIQNENSSNNN